MGGLKGADGVRSLVTGWSVSAQWFVSPLDLFSHVFTPIYWLSLGTKIHSAGLRKRRGGLGWNGALHNRICVKHDRLGVTVVCHQCCNPVYIATERDSVHSWDMPMALSFILETPSVVNCFFFFFYYLFLYGAINYIKTSLNFNLFSCYRSVLEALLTLTSAVPLLSRRCHTSSTVYMLISNL